MDTQLQIIMSRCWSKIFNGRCQIYFRNDSKKSQQLQKPGLNVAANDWNAANKARQTRQDGNLFAFPGSISYLTEICKKTTFSDRKQ